MLRLAKLEGVGNVVLEEVDMPPVGRRDVLVKVHTSLISRGSELGGRYLQQASVDASAMGYAASGVVAQVGDAVTELQVGDRVAALKPHAEYVVANLDDQRHRPPVVKLPDRASSEDGMMWPFCTSGCMWAQNADIQPGDDVVVVGQGLIGSTMIQLVRRWEPGRVIAVDALPLRCRIARQIGADEVIDASASDPVERVRALTGGRGARIVIEAVGGKWAARAFPQIQRMVAHGGNILLIGLYQDGPLPLDASLAMAHRIIGGGSGSTARPVFSDMALEILASGTFRTANMLTHRFPAARAREAFDLLYEHPGEALGVALVWE